MGKIKIFFKKIMWLSLICVCLGFASMAVSRFFVALTDIGADKKKAFLQSAQNNTTKKEKIIIAKEHILLRPKVLVVGQTYVLLHSYNNYECLLGTVEFLFEATYSIKFLKISIARNSKLEVFVKNKNESIKFKILNKDELSKISKLTVCNNWVNYE